jgi:hypothetical protein
MNLAHRFEVACEVGTPRQCYSNTRWEKEDTDEAHEAGTGSGIHLTAGSHRAEEFILEPELVLACTQPLLFAEPRQRGKEQIFE